LKAKISRALTNVLLLIFTLIPIVPQLAAHINYDNLLIPLTAWSCLLTFQVVDELRDKQPNIRTMVTLGAAGLLTSIVKYAYLPIFVAIVAFVLFTVIQQHRSKRDWSHLFKGLGQSWTRQSVGMKTVLVLGAIISLGLFFQRDGINILDYHTITPNCANVLNVQACSQYSVWNADNAWHNSVLANQSNITFENPIFYLASWVYWLWYRLFFAVNGPDSGYTNYPPLPLPSAAAAIIGVAGVVLVIVWRHRIFKDPYLSFFLLASVFYLAALFLSGWQDYHYTNVLVDMNGRYLLPVLLLIGAIMAKAFSIALRHASSMRKTALAFAVIIFFLEGGGFLTFLTRSDASWDWPNSTVVKVNNAARDVTKPLVLKGSKSYSTPYWFFN
jgi:cation transport ATPase